MLFERLRKEIEIDKERERQKEIEETKRYKEI